jgi:predicted Fe-S protein YdhL (DUF1289 family)
MENTYLKSPCWGYCVYEGSGDDKYCGGCYRTHDEITNWQTLTIEERKKIWERFEQMGDHK